MNYLTATGFAGTYVRCLVDRALAHPGAVEAARATEWLDDAEWLFVALYGAEALAEARAFAATVAVYAAVI